MDHRLIGWVRPDPVPVDLHGPCELPASDYPADFTECSLLDLLLYATAPDPNGTAIVGSSERLEFGALVRRVRSVAQHLAAVIPPQAPVAVLLPNTPSAFASILGCAVAARICIIVDPTLPPDRIGTILRDAKPYAIIQSSEHCARFDSAIPKAVRRLAMEALLDQSGDLDWSPAMRFDPDQPAFVHYTSGSTGQPKGIVTSTRAALRRSQVYLDAWHIGRADRFLATFQPHTNSGFCSSLGALCGGARVLLHSLAAEGAATLLALARDEGVTLLDGVPSLIRLLFSLKGADEAFRNLRVLRCGGESITQADIANWRTVLPPKCYIAHAYASSEAMFAAYWFIPSNYTATEQRLPAGYPLGGQDFALIDERGDPVPVGQPGELLLRSRHVAHAEWRDGGCVDGRLTIDPSQPDYRILRTGDLLCLGHDGLLRFVSRADRQIKLHGVRVEPAEIESVLRSADGVMDAAVIVRTSDHESVLLACVAANSECHDTLHGQLRAYLRAKLPPAMVPQQIVVLERLPYLASGKLDTNRLSQATAESPRVNRGLLGRLRVTARRAMSSRQRANRGT